MWLNREAGRERLRYVLGACCVQNDKLMEDAQDGIR